MSAIYPFPLQESHVKRLPPPGADGLRMIDVRVGGRWDGILVINGDGMCVGVRVRRRVEQCALPFEPSQIKEVRPACRWNRFLASIPFDVFDASLVTIFIGSPALLILSGMMLPPLGGIAAVFCVLAIYCLYQARGFLFIRPFAAMMAVPQVIIGVIWFLRWALPQPGGGL